MEEEMRGETYRRKRYYIDGHFQGRFIFVFALLASAGGVSALVLFNILADRSISTLMYTVHIPARRLSEVLSDDLLYATLLSFVVVLLGFLFVAGRVMQRVSGPLYRIRKEMERLSRGDLSSGIILRDRDEFKDFAAELNRMVESLRELFSSVREEVQAIDGRCREIERSSPDPGPVLAKSRALMQELKVLEERLRRLKL